MEQTLYSYVKASWLAGNTTNDTTAEIMRLNLNLVKGKDYIDHYSKESVMTIVVRVFQNLNYYLLESGQAYGKYSLLNQLINSRRVKK